ncbi:MAG: hypothetical protein ABIT38_06665 [Gemmatimonadaceae bacterium]
MERPVALPVAPGTGGTSAISAEASTAGVAAVDIGTLGGLYSSAWAINGQGVIAGTSQLPNGSLHMFVREADGTMIDAGVPAFARYAFPKSINSDGVVVGTTDQPRVAFRWTRRGGFQSLGGFAGECWAMDVNDRDEVVGFGEVAPGSGRLFAALWRPDTAMTLLSPPTGASSFGYAINNAGVVVGGTYDAAGTRRAFRWTPATGVRDVGAPGYANSAADINNRGTIVGDFELLDGTVRGFRLDDPWRGVDLGFFGDGRFVSPVAIGDDGSTVSLALDARSGFHSVRQRGAQQVELLPVVGSAIVLDVNRCGRAVGYSEIPSGAQHAVLWPGWC